MKIISLNVGKPSTLTRGEKSVASAIFKQPVEGPVYLDTVNFEGDAQADLIHHGGPDKAVCVYPFEHYAYWEEEWGTTLSLPAFGENLTLSGLLESTVCIGDILQLGEAVVQVSQPRQPCYKLGMKYNREDIPLEIQQTGYSGFYFRVLEKGFVSKESALSVIQRHPLAITVQEVNRLRYHDKEDVEGIRRLLSVQELSKVWREIFLKRIEDNL